MTSVTELFGSMVFDDRTMEARLPKETYRALQQTIKNGKHLDPEVADCRRQCDEGLGDREAAPRISRTGSSR